MNRIIDQMAKLQCGKCGYKTEVPSHSTSYIDQFAEMHDCEATRLQAQIERVRELHKDNSGTCSHCLYDEIHHEEYPCETIKVLDGEQ